jgi:glycosyltransferase involved in cell wall biosynthesis
MPKVSVVVPVYCASPEQEGFLRETLESIAAQTFADFETVIVDDCSPVEIAPIVKSVEGLRDVRIIRNGRNVGHAESRNAGIRAARGELIAFCDHDDLWLADKLRRQVETLEGKGDALMVFCDVEVFGPRSNRLDIDQSIIPERPSFFWFVSHGNFTITASAVMVRKAAMLEIGLFDSRYSTCDDFDAWLRILMNGPVVHLAERLARYRLHELNVNYAVDRLNDNKLLTALIWRYWKTAPTGMRIRLLPRLARKLAGRVYFTVRRHRSF